MEAALPADVGVRISLLLDRPRGGGVGGPKLVCSVARREKLLCSCPKSHDRWASNSDGIGVHERLSCTLGFWMGTSHCGPPNWV